MSNTRVCVYVFLVVAALLLFAVPVVHADGCYLVETCDSYNYCTYEQVCDPPSMMYYVELTTLPDWCTYTDSDRVHVKRDPRSSLPIAWYVIPVGDVRSAPPSDYDGSISWVWRNESACYLVTFA